MRRFTPYGQTLWYLIASGDDTATELERFLGQVRFVTLEQAQELRDWFNL